MKPMPEEMKEELQRKREAQLIHDRIHTQKRTKFPERKRGTYILPEGYTSGQWKKALRIIKGRKLKKPKRK